MLQAHPARAARIRIVARIHPTHAELRLQVPMLSQNPRITVQNSGSRTPSLVAARAQQRKVGPQERNSVFQTAYVVLPAQRMHADEMSCKTVAEPITDRRFRKPVLPLAPAGHRPAVVISQNFERPPRRKPHFHADIHVRKCVAQHVGLHPHALTASRPTTQRRYLISFVYFLIFLSRHDR